MSSKTNSVQLEYSEEFLTAPEAAKILRQKNYRQLDNWRCERRGPPFIKPAGTVLYPRSWLLAWMADPNWLPQGWNFPEKPIRRVGVRMKRMKPKTLELCPKPVESEVA